MNAQIFLVISLGAIGFLPNTFSRVSVRPAKVIAYPPNAGFLAAFDLAPFFAVDFVVFLVVFFVAANFFSLIFSNKLL